MDDELDNDLENTAAKLLPASPENIPLPAATDSHAFVIRIWLEEITATEAGLWRGHITHVLDERRRYFENLPDVVGFITPYLDL